MEEGELESTGAFAEEQAEPVQETQEQEEYGAESYVEAGETVPMEVIYSMDFRDEKGSRYTLDNYTRIHDAHMHRWYLSLSVLFSFHQSEAPQGEAAAEPESEQSSVSSPFLQVSLPFSSICSIAHLFLPSSHTYTLKYPEFLFLPMLCQLPMEVQPGEPALGEPVSQFDEESMQAEGEEGYTQEQGEITAEEGQEEHISHEAVPDDAGEAANEGVSVDEAAPPVSAGPPSAVRTERPRLSAILIPPPMAQGFETEGDDRVCGMEESIAYT